MRPLVSVICLCYNHEKFVEEALRSVLFQQYSPFEMIIVDDASQDESRARIHKFLAEIAPFRDAYQVGAAYPLPPNLRIEFIEHEENQGNCASFNEAWKLAKGKYIIDFATDDVLLDTRLAQQVALLESLPKEVGVVFSNALEIDAQGKPLNYHYPVDQAGKSKQPVPNGNIYKAVLEKYFICTASMMIRQEVLEALGGYDEDLSYEDFDFWVRSSRAYQYHYQDEVTTLRRVVKNSHSAQFYRRGKNPHLLSTYKVCEKAKNLNQNSSEDKALAQCVRYHQRQAFYTENFDLVFQFEALSKELEEEKTSLITKIILWLSQRRFSVYHLYKVYFYIKKQSNKLRNRFQGI